MSKPTPQMDIAAQFWINVLLLDDVNCCTVRASSRFRVFGSEPENQTTSLYVGHANVPTSIKVSSEAFTVDAETLVGKEVTILPEQPYIINLNGDEYRGKLKLVMNRQANRFDVVNLVPLEPYLAGVIGAEMPDYWEPEALKAQAIAARTYALYIKGRFGYKRKWDVKKTQANQVYLGVKAESAQIWRAVNQTQAQVLACTKHGSPTSDEPSNRHIGPAAILDSGYELFPSYYSSACGGHTENSLHVFGDSFQPLRGVQCPYCRRAARGDFFFWPMVQFDKKDVTRKLVQKYAKLKDLGEIKDITPAKQRKYGKFSRITSVKLTGSTGKTNFLRAEDLRLTIDPTGLKFRSTICKILNMGDKFGLFSGRGFGHGVGMCQYGAQEMARQGKTTEQILEHYYPGSRIFSIDYR